MPNDVAPLPQVERLSPRVIRIVGGNPGKFTLQGTNTYLVGTGSHRLLIDTGEGITSWKEALQQLLSSETATVQTALITHRHSDHVGGIQDLLALCPSAEVYKCITPGEMANFNHIENSSGFSIEGASLRALYCPGHTRDHTVFKLEEEDALFSGDAVLGHGTTVFEDLVAYMDSLELIRSFGQGRIYPGHGQVVEDGNERIEEYIRHRKERERQIVTILKASRLPADGQAVSSASTKASELVKVIYVDVPIELHPAAEHGIVQTLKKLEHDGVVARQGDGWRVVEV
ncbi:MAG: hypothetical protein M1814_006510 [Vezdaea aestivalis]|nr:MAG: hypothetical protein M1814_006510 [Vezdaea aestivalis]